MFGALKEILDLLRTCPPDDATNSAIRALSDILAGMNEYRCTSDTGPAREIARGTYTDYSGTAYGSRFVCFEWIGAGVSFLPEDAFEKRFKPVERAMPDDALYDPSARRRVKSPPDWFEKWLLPTIVKSLIDSSTERFQEVHPDDRQIALGQGHDVLYSLWPILRGIVLPDRFDTIAEATNAIVHLETRMHECERQASEAQIAVHQLAEVLSMKADPSSRLVSEALSMADALDDITELAR